MLGQDAPEGDKPGGFFEVDDVDAFYAERRHELAFVAPPKRCGCTRRSACAWSRRRRSRTCRAGDGRVAPSAWVRRRGGCPARRRVGVGARSRVGSVRGRQQPQVIADYVPHAASGGRVVPQLHLYGSDAVAAELRARACERRTSVSKLLAEIVTHDTRRAWPEGWLDRVAGAWRDPWPTVDDPPPGERRSRPPWSMPSANPSRRYRSTMPLWTPTRTSALSSGLTARRSAPTT